jgi:hypothetical protein
MTWREKGQKVEVSLNHEVSFGRAWVTRPHSESLFQEKNDNKN